LSYWPKHIRGIFPL